MKALQDNSRNLLHDCMAIIFLCGTIGIAVKFVTFMNQWVYFPSFPNALDAMFLISAVIYLTWTSTSRRRK